MFPVFKQPNGGFMKTSVKVVFCMLFVATLLAASCVPQETAEIESTTPENELIGAWKLIQIEFTGPDARTITDPQPSFCIFTDKYLAIVGAMGDEPRPELSEEPTDAELAAAYRSFIANFFEYEADGNTITNHVLVSKNPNVKSGSNGTMEYKIEGNTLTITPRTNSEGPVENPLTATLERIE